MDQYIKYLCDYPEFGNQEGTISCPSGPASPLRSLCSKYGLASWFQGDSDLERIASMMRHVHCELFCCKDMVQPKSMDFESIMAAKQTGSVYCSCYAVCLTEALLAVGVPAVQVACLPFEFDGDCHVGVLAYISDSDRAAFFDPTFCTYFHDGNAPLDLFAIRDAYRRGQPPQFVPILIDKQWPLFLNDNEYADYNSWYRDYMAKNCFRFAAAEDRREGDAGSSVRRCFINPVGFSSQNQYDARYSDRVYLQVSSLKPVPELSDHTASL